MYRFYKYILTTLFFSLCLFLGGCASVVYSTRDILAEKMPASIEVPKYNPLLTEIGSIYKDILTENGNISGAALLKSGNSALIARIALCRMAKHTIELQTYIYENDPTSRLFMYEIKKAADRGVIIRILIDDNGLDSDYSYIVALDCHPNIEVRVFNPFKYRQRILKYPQYLFHLSRINYRMHNKLFIADDSAVIIGGRNIANRYFDAGTNINFSDTDILFLGKLASDSKMSFNDYWNYHRSIPVSLFPERKNQKFLDDIEKSVNIYKSENSEIIENYEKEINKFINGFKSKNNNIFWGEGILISDSPEKTDSNLIVSPISSSLEDLFLNAKNSIYMVSAYLVPGKNAANKLLDAKKRGIDIYILTNSLSSTDVSVTYSAWRKYRDKFVKNGINVYEFRKEGEKIRNKHKSAASLHSKIIVFDDYITWIGSFNIDPRSALINTEVAAVFFSRDFALKAKESIKEDMADGKSWRLENNNDRILWKSKRDGKEEIFFYSPDTSIMGRFLMILGRIIPESMI